MTSDEGGEKLPSQNEEGFWMRNAEKMVSVSASDLERHKYCPKSFELAREGNTGVGEALESGVEKHKEIHQRVSKYAENRLQYNRSTAIWTWWFTVIIAFILDAILLDLIDDVNISTNDAAEFLSVWALVILIIGVLLVYLPWRKLIGWETPEEDVTVIEMFENTWESKNFAGGWFEAGKIEAIMLMSAILLGLHAIGLIFASDRSQAIFILILTAMIWTLLASWQLQKTLIDFGNFESSKEELGIQDDIEIAYSDDEESSDLLKDETIGLRGRPDQIVIVDGEFIPVEQKTGKIPNKPYDSHKMQLMAYLHLVSVNTKRKIPYGVLRYGDDTIFRIEWNEESKSELFKEIKEVQRLLVNGGAMRNHERKGKCMNCSRKYACDQSLAD